MKSSKLINEDPCSNHGLLDGVGNIINNVYLLKHVKHDKDEFIRYNCSQQIDNVNNTHLQWRSQGLPGWATRPPGGPK